ncbi:MAG: GDCCVxC domain-containing (seleno)protein [Gemmatimonadaceae bacterium]
MGRESVITCPVCGKGSSAEMPLDACQFFFECPECHTMLRPKSGDCCVFCSYGSEPCPPRREGRDDVTCLG